ncbi:hypothetical protein TrRE_jg1289 [Triparma retinervis]|uniref:Uncharacterized protein n=1 Tax=Triparma retinervis TaxID=2557542 RepID=A0A9W6ZG94_9STRA|nr:hypothetical protein TrRE_jg1289 [Triparma retinervis]
MKVKHFAEVGEGGELNSELNSDEDPDYDEIVPLNVNDFEGGDDVGEKEEEPEKKVETTQAKVATEEDDIAALLAQAEEAIAGADTVLKKEKAEEEEEEEEEEKVMPTKIGPKVVNPIATKETPKTADPTDLVRKLADGVLDSAGFKREVRSDWRKGGEYGERKRVVKGLLFG